MKKPARWDVVVVGEASFDYLARGPVLPGPGQSLKAESFERAVGGRGVNAAMAAARLGARVAFVGRVGKDARGDDIIDRLTADGVSVDFLARDGREPTGVALMMIDATGQRQVMTAPGANNHVTTQDVEEAAAALESAKVVLSELALPQDAVLRAAGLAKASGALFLLGPAPGRSHPSGLLALCDLVALEFEEALALTDIRCDDESSAAAAAQRLLSHGARAACLPAGGRGDLLIWPGGRLLLRPPAHADDWDVFCGAMAAALSEGQRWEEAGRCAAVAAQGARQGSGALFSAKHQCVKSAP